MECKMFNMGFGESILLREGDETLLVDCGSEMEKARREQLFLEIEQQLSIARQN